MKNFELKDETSGCFTNNKNLDGIIEKLLKEPELIDDLMFDELEIVTEYLKARNEDVKRRIKDGN